MNEIPFLVLRHREDAGVSGVCTRETKETVERWRWRRRSSNSSSYEARREKWSPVCLLLRLRRTPSQRPLLNGKFIKLQHTRISALFILDYFSLEVSLETIFRVKLKISSLCRERTRREEKFSITVVPKTTLFVITFSQKHKMYSLIAVKRP